MDGIVVQPRHRVFEGRFVAYNLHLGPELLVDPPRTILPVVMQHLQLLVDLLLADFLLPTTVILELFLADSCRGEYALWEVFSLIFGLK